MPRALESLWRSRCMMSTIVGRRKSKQSYLYCIFFYFVFSQPDLPVWNCLMLIAQGRSTLEVIREISCLQLIDKPIKEWKLGM
jgi:hypothetical protein